MKTTAAVKLVERTVALELALRAIVDTTHQPDPKQQGAKGLNVVAPGKMRNFSTAINAARAVLTHNGVDETDQGRVV